MNGASTSLTEQFSHLKTRELTGRSGTSSQRRDKSVKVGIEAKRKRAGWDEKYLLKILTQ